MFQDEIKGEFLQRLAIDARVPGPVFGSLERIPGVGYASLVVGSPKVFSL